MGTVANLLAGTATLYIAPTGEAAPEIDDLTPPAVTIGTPGGNWTATGFTVDSMEITYTPTHSDVMVNEHNGPVDTFLTDEAGSISFTLAENDLQAWSEAINTASVTATAAGADQVAKDVIGAGDGTLSEKALLIVGTSPEAGSRVIQVWRAVQDAEATYTYSKEHNGIPVGFKMLNDTTQTAGERLFKVTDVTAVASS